MSTGLSQRWSSGAMALIALFGFTLSFGAIWLLPYITGENGAGSFLLFYVLCLAIFAVPLQMGALAIGRRGRGDPVAAIRSVCEQDRRPTFWVVIGAVALLACFIVLSYFSVIAGWVVDYLYIAGTGRIHSIDAMQVSNVFGEFMTNWPLMIAGHTVFIMMTVVASALGPRQGLQPILVVCASLVLLSMVILFVISLNIGAAWDAFRYLYWDFGRLSTDAALSAIGQAFFLVSVGTGVILALGAHLPATTSIARVSIFSVLLILVVSCVAGVTTFSFLFAAGLEPGVGPSLVFTSLPVAFGSLDNGMAYTVLLLIMMLAIAWGSAIGLMEPLVMWSSRLLRASRPVAAILSGLLVWAFGLLSLFSFSLDSRVTIFDRTPFEILDYLASNILIPVAGLLLAFFAAWGISRHINDGELRFGGGYPVWQILTGIMAPIAIIATVVWTIAM